MFKIVCALLVGKLAFVASAQEPLPAPQGGYVEAHLDTGAFDNHLESTALTFAGEVRVPGASWVRVHFSSAKLSPGSYVVITSALDHDSQILNDTSMAQWEHSSAYFNGECARIELYLGAGAQGDRIAIERVEAGPPIEAWTARGEGGQSGICGADDRMPSNQNWSGRLMPIGCSGTIVCEDSTILSAGHCYAIGLVMQFNVPNSTGACATVQPPVVDQFPLTSRRADSFGPGQDWFVLSAGVNSLGQTPFQRYGMLRRPAAAISPIGTVVESFGFGRDVTCELNQRQQRSYGTIVGISPTYYTFNADVRGGSSGSAIVANGELVGIVTHGSGECVNIATRVDLANLQTALRTTMTCDDPVSLSVNADAGVAITLDTPDLAGLSNGTGTFTRTYPYAATVRLTAPAQANGQCFQHWVSRGIDQGPNRTLSVTLNGSANVQAFYASSCCGSDLDDGTRTGTRDGAVTIDDLVYFLDRFEVGAQAADLDDDGEPAALSPDGAVDINDLLVMLARFQQGC